MSVVDIRPLNRAERRKQNTRDRLKQAALEILLTEGYAAMTIQGITDRADLGYGTFYLHFADKDAIVWELLYDNMETSRLAVETTIADVPYPRREYLSWVAIFQRVQEGREVFLEIYGRHGSAALTQRFQDYMSAIHLENLRQHRYQNPVSHLPMEVAAQFAAGALMRLLLWWAETPTDHTPEDMAAMLFELMYRHPVSAE
jgi:AcrR family transcriptional regulator